MKLISNYLYNKIPLVYKIENMSMPKLVKFAMDNYGIIFTPISGCDKASLITDILFCEKDIEKLKGSD